MGVGSQLARLEGYPFEVRYSDGTLVRATAAAEVAAAAYIYFSRLFSAVAPDIAVIVADQADWPSRGPYGLPFFSDDAGQIRPGVVVMSAAAGYSTLDELEAHYTGGDDPMSPLNYVWFQYRWQRLAGGVTGASSHSRSQPGPRTGDPRLALAAESRAR